MSPEITTLRPVVHVPTKAIGPLVLKPAAGAVMAISGAALLRTKLRLSEPVLPALSVCAATTFLTPSTALNVIAAENWPFTQAAVDGAETPPETLTTKPVSHVPDKVTPACAWVLAAGAKITTTGATVSRKKSRL